MTIDTGSGTFHPTRPARRGRAIGWGLLLFSAGWVGASLIPRSFSAEPVLAQSAGQRLLSDYQVLFQFTQDSRGVGGSSNDQITVIFSNRSAEGAAPPTPIFGEDILQEFSFSALDFANNQLRMSRRVRDKSFLDAKFVRVINHGDDGWAGTHITLTVDGEPVLRNVGLSPRRGRSAAGGIEKFNLKEWANRAYWEAELQPLRSASRRSTPSAQR